MVQFLEGRNRAWAQLDAPINGSDTNVALVAWQGSRLSDVTTASGRKVRAQIYERDAETGAITKCELVNITNNVSDVLIIERAVEGTRATDTTNTYAATPQSFTANAIIEEVISSEVLSEIQDEVNRIVDEEIPLLLTKEEYNSERVPFIASSAWDDDYEITSADITTYENGRTFKVQADVANTGPSTLKLNALAAKSLKKLSWGAFTALATWDIIANQIFWATYNQTEDCFQFSVDPATATTVSPTPSDIRENCTLNENMTVGDIVFLDADWEINQWNWYKTAGDTFNASGITSAAKAVMIDATTVLIAYYYSSACRLVAGTISGNTITFWSSVSVSVNANNFAICKIDTLAACLFLRSGTAYTGYPITVSGTTVTLWTWVQVNGSTSSTVAESISICQIATNKVAFWYISGASANLNARIGSISSNVLTLGTEKTNITSDVHTNYTAICKLDTDKFIISAQNGTTLKTLACTVSGTTITNWSTISTTMLTTVIHGLIQVDTDKAMLIYSLGSDSMARILTVSGTTVTAQTAYIINTGITYATLTLAQTLACPFGTDTYALWPFSGSQWDQKISFVRVNLSTYAIETMETVNYALSNLYSPCYYAPGKIIVGPESSNPGKAYILNNNARKIIGILQETGTAWQSKPVAMEWSISSVHSWLIPWEPYYIQLSGGIGLASALYSSSTGNTAIRKIGIAKSTTKLLLQS